MAIASTILTKEFGTGYFQGTNTTKLFDDGSCYNRPSEDELLQLAELLNSHKKVTIYCGLGAAEAHDEIIQLAEKLKSPVAYSYKAKMAIQYDNPYEVGLTGLLGIPSAFQKHNKFTPK